nr:FAD-binding oxidoreductase [Streptomyces sp. NBC_00886]
MQAVVIGAGVIGLSVATELGRRGVHVTVVEQGAPGAGTSAASYGWVNANNKEPRAYHELNRAGLEAHRKLAQTTGGTWLQAGGHLEVATDPVHQEELAQRLSRLCDLGYEAELITQAQARELIPDLIIGPDAGPIAYFPREAYCFPQLYLAHLLSTAAGLGVKVISGNAVQTIDVAGGRPVLGLADGTVLSCNHVVSCVGRWTQSLLKQADVTLPMTEFEHAGDATVGYIAVTNPLPVSLARLLTTSQLNVRPDGGGRLMLQALGLDATADPRDIPATDAPVAKELLDRLNKALSNTSAARRGRVARGPARHTGRRPHGGRPAALRSLALRSRHPQRNHSRPSAGRPRGKGDPRCLRPEPARPLPARSAAWQAR